MKSVEIYPSLVCHLVFYFSEVRRSILVEEVSMQNSFMLFSFSRFVLLYKVLSGVSEVRFAYFGRLLGWFHFFNVRTEKYKNLK